MMIQTMLGHFYQPDESVEQRSASAADWVAALRKRPLGAVAEARRRWLAERQRRPTIAEFIQWVDAAEAEESVRYQPEGGRQLLPEPTEHDGSKTPPSRMTVAELWSWHARIRAFRKRSGLLGPSPVDPEGKFADTWLDSQAEAELAERTPPKPAIGGNARHAEAEQIREQWARDNGCTDFKHAMSIGLAKVAKRTGAA